MTEKSFLWNTGASGDSGANVPQADWALLAKIIGACNGYEGVAPVANYFVGTVTGANTVQIGTGDALVDGHPYYNSAAVNVNIPSATGGGNTRIDRIVLRAVWASYTVRITRIAGTDAASPTAPAITQTSGATYDIMLYQALVDTGGTVTITDERLFADHKLAARQGGSATDWDQPGTNNYTLSGTKIQAGMVTSSNSNYVTVTFPSAYALCKPLVMVSPYSATAAIATVDTITVSEFRLNAYDKDAARVFCDVAWLAIGAW